MRSAFNSIDWCQSTACNKASFLSHFSFRICPNFLSCKHSPLPIIVLNVEEGRLDELNELRHPELDLCTLQSIWNIFANSVEPDKTAHQDLLSLCQSISDFWLRPIFRMTVLSQLKEGKVHYRHSGVKGLGKYDIGSAIWPFTFTSYWANSVVFRIIPRKQDLTLLICPILWKK